MLFEEALNIAKASPLLMFTTAILGYFLTYEKTFFNVANWFFWKYTYKLFNKARYYETNNGR